MGHGTIFVCSLLVAFVSSFLFRKLALKCDILDNPNHRKMHTEPIPLLGGLGVYCGIMTGLLLGVKDIHFLLGFGGGITIILILGLIDDCEGVSARLRLIGQLVATLIMIGFGMRLSFLPNNLWGNIGEILLTIVWILGITNATNYLDGIDGLASGIIALGALFFSLIAYQTAQPLIGLISLLLIGSCLGFLPHNFRKKKMFLGDGGSTALGFTIAAIALLGNWAEDNIVKLTIPVLILGVPIFDMIFTTIMRIKEKKIRTIVEWFEYGGKDHFHHHLIHLGLRHIEATLFIYFVSISFGISAIMVSNERAFLGFLSIIQASIIFAAIAVLMVAGKKHRDTASSLQK